MTNFVWIHKLLKISVWNKSLAKRNRTLLKHTEKQELKVILLLRHQQDQDQNDTRLFGPHFKYF